MNCPAFPAFKLGVQLNSPGVGHFGPVLVGSAEIFWHIIDKEIMRAMQENALPSTNKTYATEYVNIYMCMYIYTELFVGQLATAIQ